MAGFNFSVSYFLLTGNQGGSYSINGTFGGAQTFAPSWIANMSNTELRILAPVTGSAPVFSGSGVISFGSPTTTYRANAGYSQIYYITADEVRVYAGTDNLSPNFGTGVLYAVGTMRLLGSGTGRTLASALLLRPNAKLQVEEDWTVDAVLASALDARCEVSVATGKTLTVNRWSQTSYALGSGGTVGIADRFRKTGAGRMVYKSTPLQTSTPAPLWRIEEGDAEFNITTDTFYGRPTGAMPIELLTGTTLTYNSTMDFDSAFVTFGAGAVIKSNTNKVTARVFNSFTGGLTVNAGEWDAQYRNAVGDGNVTVAGGTLRASGVSDDQYVLEVAGNLVFSGGSLALGAAYVA